MLAGDMVQVAVLDVNTLAFAAVCLAGLLGVLLIFTWIQQRNVPALAWWGSAYLLGASSIALWNGRGLVVIPAEVAQALTFLACGMVWNGVRLFQGRRVLPTVAFAGAIAWLVLCQLPMFESGSYARAALGVVVVACYAFFIGWELGRERRKSAYSPTAAIVVPVLHAAIFLMPLGIDWILPDRYATQWMTVFTLETMIYAVGTAFLVLLLVKDHAVHVYRNEASTDHLTGLLNRRAFLENARALCAREGGRGRPVTLMMFDLDHFKSINDRFGHAVGDDVLRVFAQVMRSGTRANDIVGRLGGEEFAVIVPGTTELAAKIGERIRSGLQAAGAVVSGIEVGATVSIGAACACDPVMEIGPLLVRADAALYRAKHDGRNRFHAAADEPHSEHAQAVASAIRAQAAVLERNSPA